jgi:CheY-like chemotaxis protein
LLADDSVTAQNMGRRILMDAGYEVVTVNNGSAALKKIHENRPDLVVLDVYMPGYGGLEVCQRLKESADTSKIPVLLTVGKMEPFKAEEAKRVRADGHIVKPFEASELLAALARLEDRIVPQAEPSRVLRKSGAKKSQSQSQSRQVDAGQDPARIPEPPSESVTYLSEIKRRSTAQAQNEAAQDFAVNAESTMAPVEVPVVMEQETAREVDAPAARNATQQDSEIAPVFSSGPASASAQTESERDEPRSDEPRPQEAKPRDIVAESSSVEVVSRERRWIAESVPVTAEEASLALDQEMEKAQQNEHAPVSISAAAVVEAAVVESAVGESAIVSGVVESSVVESGALPSAAGQGASESISDGDTSGINSDRSSDSVSAVPEPHSDEATAIAKASFAAAASAGISTSGAEVNRNIPDSELAAAPSEAAAAWDNWQHIRDSVMSPQKAAAIAESAAIIVQANITAENGGAPAAEQPILESSAIANIVDSVLAELKPKLMQEIAKKMAAEKK